MPRDRIIIDKFGLGMACSVSTEDMNQNAAFYCKDVNLLGLEGKLIGVPGSTDKSSAIGAVGNIQGHAFIQKTDGKWTFIFSDTTAAEVKYLQDFYGTPGSITSLFANTGSQVFTTMIIRNSTVRMGWKNTSGAALTPQWVGYTDNTYFGNAASTALQYSDQECKVYQDTNGTLSTGTSGLFNIVNVVANDLGAGYFSIDKTYYYKYAVEYDGYQMSPLSTLGSLHYYAFPATYFQSKIKIAAYGVASGSGVFSGFANKRITAILLFRAEGDTTNSPTPSTAYRLVDRIAMDNADWGTVGDHKVIEYTDTGNEGATYEAYAGCAETATSNTMKWGIATNVDNYMFIGNCLSSDLEEAPYLIFRSVAGRFDMYNWQSSTPEFIRMPTIPTAMCGYFGRLIVWDENNMYRVNADSLAIEETIAGYGCMSQQSYVVTKYGVYFADKNGVYIYDGTKIERISGNIDLWEGDVTVDATTYSDASYRKIASYGTSTNPIKMAYNPLTDMVILAINTTSTTVVMYGYCVQTKGWTLLSSPGTFTSAFSFFHGKDGGTYMAGRASSTNYLYKLLDNEASRTSWTWISKRINGNKNDESQYQSVYKIKTTGTFSGNAYYGIDGGVMDSQTSSGSLASNKRRSKVLRFAIVGSTAQYVNDISVIFREMIGVR